MSIKKQYQLLWNLQFIMLVLLVVDIVVLYQRTHELLHFDYLVFLFIIAFLLFTAKGRYRTYQAQMDEHSKHLNMQSLVIGIFCSLFAVALLLLYLYHLSLNVPDFISGEPPLILMMSNYEFYTIHSPVLSVREDACFVGNRWFLYEEMKELYVEPRNRREKQLIIYTKQGKRYAYTIRKELMEILFAYLPHSIIKEAY